MAYTRCTSLKQVAQVLRNYDGYLYKDTIDGGYWMEVDLSEHYGKDAKELIKVANRYFKARGWTKGWA